MSNSMRPHRRQPTRLPCPWDSPGKNTGVGCHFLLQCMKVKNESEIAQSCQTLSDPMDCSLPGSSVHGIFQARVLEWGAIAFFGPWLTSFLFLPRYYFSEVTPFKWESPAFSITFSLLFFLQFLYSIYHILYALLILFYHLSPFNWNGSSMAQEIFLVSRLLASQIPRTVPA